MFLYAEPTRCTKAMADSSSENITTVVIMDSVDELRIVSSRLSTRR